MPRNHGRRCNNGNPVIGASEARYPAGLVTCRIPTSVPLCTIGTYILALLLYTQLFARPWRLLQPSPLGLQTLDSSGRDNREHQT